ncbi:hypothetical protein, partial [Thiolapillus sp.]|uniref:hypothetical protein n=1 Tax=Thiolapillus sp. TaxID=2017437 RepID=UPI003AF978D0
PRSEAYFVFPLAQGTPGKQCGLAATGDYQPSLRSPWLAAMDDHAAISRDDPVRLNSCQTALGMEEFIGDMACRADMDPVVLAVHPQ